MHQKSFPLFSGHLSLATTSLNGSQVAQGQTQWPADSTHSLVPQCARVQWEHMDTDTLPMARVRFSGLKPPSGATGTTADPSHTVSPCKTRTCPRPAPAFHQDLPLSSTPVLKGSVLQVKAAVACARVPWIPGTHGNLQGDYHLPTCSAMTGAETTQEKATRTKLPPSDAQNMCTGLEKTSLLFTQLSFRRRVQADTAQ